MKKLHILNYLVVAILVLFSFSCSETESGDVTPPGILTVNSVTPTNGGGIISYDLPSDTDILFVRAKYTNTNGEEVSRVSSKYNNEIEISGLKVWSVAEGAMLAIMDEHLKPSLEQLRAVVEAGPVRLVILEDVMAGDDQLKTNLVQHAKTHGVELWSA